MEDSRVFKNFANFHSDLAFVRVKDRKKHSNFHLQSSCDTIHEKVSSILVHSFVRNQPERRWGQFFSFLFSHRNDTSLQCIYSYACKFVIGHSIYIKSRKFVREPSVGHQRFSDDRGGEFYLSTAHGHYLCLSVCLFITLNTIALIFLIV